MQYSLHPLKDIDLTTIASLARLHISSMGLLLSEMGAPFVLRYFQIAARDPAVIGFYAVSDTNDLVGYVLGTSRPDRLNAQLTKPLMWFTGQCLRLLFTRPHVLWQAFVSSSSQPGQMADQAGAIELVYVAVNPMGRGQGVGRALMHAFEDACRKAGYQRILATQELENEASIGLFSAMGYHVKHEYQEGQYARQRMELLLKTE